MGIGMATGAGLALLIALNARFEGDGPVSVEDGVAVHRAYPDPAHGWAVPTICQGHTRGVFKGQTATAAQCELLIAEDYQAHVQPTLERYVHVPVTPNQGVALALAVNNLGRALFYYRNSNGQWVHTQFHNKLNAGDCHGAAAHFGDFVKAGGKVMRGLVKRRAEERALFEADCRYWDALE
jgi:lysozyme